MSFGSVAVGETKPQRIGPRRFSVLTEMMVLAIWLARPRPLRADGNYLGY
jgi:hypothetical protein